MANDMPVWELDRTLSYGNEDEYRLWLHKDLYNSKRDSEYKEFALEIMVQAQRYDDEDEGGYRVGTPTLILNRTGVRLELEHVEQIDWLLEQLAVAKQKMLEFEDANAKEIYRSETQD